MLVAWRALTLTIHECDARGWQTLRTLSPEELTAGVALPQRDGNP